MEESVKKLIMLDKEQSEKLAHELDGHPFLTVKVKTNAGTDPPTCPPNFVFNGTSCVPNIG